MAEAPALQEDIPHAAHPLEPLCADEIRAAVAIVRDEQNLDGRALFETVELREPDKAVVRGFAPGHDVAREANVVVIDRTAGRSYAGVVSLSTGRISAWRPIEGGQPHVLGEELEEAERLVKADPDFLAGLRKRGIEDVDQVVVDMLGVGDFGAPEESSMRLLRLHLF